MKNRPIGAIYSIAVTYSYISAVHGITKLLALIFTGLQRNSCMDPSVFKVKEHLPGAFLGLPGFESYCKKSFMVARFISSVFACQNF